MVALADRSRDARSAPGVLLGMVSALVCIAVLIAVAAFSSTPADQLPEPAAVPLPATTMAPVQPEEKAVKPPAATPASATGVSPQWVAQIAGATGIGDVAVAAYGSATLRLATEQPGCKLGWTTLAGIGGIESGHGTFGDAQVQADGTASPPIIGPALNGKTGFAAIESTEESQQWHGDPQWDRAVGPMQFIPSTWEKWQSDGDEDGVSDPHNIFDAAYAAGRYLCASGADLTTGEGWTRAVFSYNHSEQYVRDVLARANSYAG